jgi:hypothetical protein
VVAVCATATTCRTLYGRQPVERSRRDVARNAIYSARWLPYSTQNRGMCVRLRMCCMWRVRSHLSPRVSVCECVSCPEVPRALCVLGDGGEEKTGPEQALGVRRRLPIRMWAMDHIFCGTRPFASCLGGRKYHNLGGGRLVSISRVAQSWTDRSDSRCLQLTSQPRHCPSHAARISPTPSCLGSPKPLDVSSG